MGFYRCLDDPSVYDDLKVGDVVALAMIHKQLTENEKVEVHVPQKDMVFTTSHNLTPHMIEVLLSGGLTNWVEN